MERLRIVIDGWTLDNADKVWVQTDLQKLLDAHEPFADLHLKAGRVERDTMALH